MEHYKQLYLNNAPFVQKLVDNDYRVLVYNGDVDTVCNTIGNAQFVADDIKVSLVEENEAWMLSNTLPNIAGFVTRYSSEW